MLKLAEAARTVIEATNRADADVLKQQVSVYRDEADYVRAKLYEKTAPNLQSVITSDTNGGLFGLPVTAQPAPLVESAAPAAKPAAPPKPVPPPVEPAKKGGATP